MSRVIVFGPSGARRQQLIDALMKLPLLKNHSLVLDWNDSEIPADTVVVTDVWPDDVAHDVLLVDLSAAKVCVNCD